jgi:hypothetical protein
MENSQDSSGENKNNKPQKMMKKWPNYSRSCIFNLQLAHKFSLKHFVASFCWGTKFIWPLRRTWYLPWNGRDPVQRARCFVTPQALGPPELCVENTKIYILNVPCEFALAKMYSLTLRHSMLAKKKRAKIQTTSTSGNVHLGVQQCAQQQREETLEPTYPRRC